LIGSRKSSIGVSLASDRSRLRPLFPAALAMEARLAVLVATGHGVDEWRTPRAPRLDGGGGAKEGAHGVPAPSLAPAPFHVRERQHHLCRAMAA
jgi:hypothetical protein